MWQVTCSGLCIHGALGKGTLCRYPSFRVPTHPFRALSTLALGRKCGKFSIWNTMHKQLCVCSQVVFTLVVSQNFSTWVPAECVHILCKLITYPKKSHFYKTRMLLFDCVIGNPHSSRIITMYWIFWLGMPHIWQEFAKILCSFDNCGKGLQAGLPLLMQQWISICLCHRPWYWRESIPAKMAWLAKS